jgi:phosphomevalonate kinase
MRARAPGKLVLSGAYAVLEGARAIVVAVDRFVYAETGRAAEFVTPEVRAAIADDRAPFFDASELRADDRKLGLGSSAAILVSSLGALELAARPDMSLVELRERVFPVALSAHRRAQGGGSGVDVAASTFGGVLVVMPEAATLATTAATLPAGLQFAVLASRTPSSTPEMIRRVQALRANDPGRYGALMGAQRDASEAAADALLAGDAPSLLRALSAQGNALAALGDAAGVPIVPPELRELQRAAARQGAAVLPAGAGGGDVSWWVSSGAEPPRTQGLSRLELRLGAMGLCAYPENS